MSTDDYTLNLDTTQYQQSMASANAITQQFTGSVNSLTAGSKTLSLGLLALVPGIGILTKGFGGFAAQAAAMEQNMSGLKATAAVSGQSFDKLSQTALGLARSLPVGNQAAIAMVSQLQSLGVAGDGSVGKINALGTEFIKLAAATGSSAAGIAQSMVGVTRAFGDTTLDPKRIGRFADSLTTLQAKFGGSAEGIASFTKQIAPFARSAGLGESATMGISAAFSKLGDDGYAAGTAVSKVMADIGKSVRDGSPQMFTYAALVGKTADQFRLLQKANPAEAIVQVMEALGNGPQGQRALEALGLDGVRTQRAIAEAGGSNELRKAVATAVGGYGNGSTETGSQAALSGLNDSLTKLQSTTEQVAAAFGAPFLTPLRQLSDALGFFAGGLGKFASSNILQEGAKLIGTAGFAFMATKFAGMFGQAGIAGNLIRRSAIPTEMRAGRLIETYGGMDEARAASEDIGGRVGKANLRALGYHQHLIDKGEDRSKYENMAYGASDFASETSRLDRQSLDERVATARMNLGLGPGGAGAGPAGDEIEAKIRREAGQGIARRGVRGAYRAVRPYASRAAEAYGSWNNQLARMEQAQRESPANTIEGSRPQGTFRPVADAYKAAWKGEGPTGGKFRDVWNTTQAGWRQVGAEGEMEGGASALRRIGTGLTAGPRANLAMAGRMGWAGLRGIAPMAGPAVLMGLAGQAFSGIRQSSSQMSQQGSDFMNQSISGTMDKYRDSVGAATANVKTFSETASMGAKAISAAVKNMADATTVNAATINNAQSLTTPIVHQFGGSASDVAAQVSGLAVGGMGPGDMAAIRDDLIRQRGGDQARQILAQVDTSGQSTFTGANGTGSASKSFIQGSLNPFIKTGKPATFGIGNEGDRSNAQVVGQATGAILDGVGHLFGKNWQLGQEGQLNKKDKAQLDTYVETLGRQRDAQGSRSGTPYATQEYMKSANDTIKYLMNNGASDDEIKVATQEFASTLGAGTDVQLNRGDIGKGSFTSALQQRSKSFRTSFGDLTKNNAGFSVNGKGMSGTAVKGIDATLIAGATSDDYAKYFDNTRANKLSSQIDDVTTGQGVGDANKLASTAGALINAMQGAGSGLSKIQIQAFDAAEKLGGLGGAALQAEIATRAASAEQRQEIFQTPGQALGQGLRFNLAKATDMSTGPNGQPERDKGVTGVTQTVQGAVQFYQQRIMAAFDFNKQSLRQGADFIRQSGYQQDDFKTQTMNQEEDRLIGVYRANRNYHQQVAKSDHDFYLSRERQQQDFALNMKRGAEDAAKAMYDPYHRIQTEAIWDGNSMIENLGEQAKAAQLQMADLAAARKKGLTNAAIQALGLADASHGQELHALVQDASQNKGLIGRLNTAVSTKAGAVTGLYNDPGNVAVQRAKEDNARVQRRALADYKFNMAYSYHLFVQSGVEQTQDYERQLTRANVLFQLSMSREAAEFKITKDRMMEDYIDSTKTLNLSLSKLQSAFNKGLNQSMDDTRSVMVDSVSQINTALQGINLDKLQALIDDPRFGTLSQSLAGLGNVSLTPAGGMQVAPQYVPVHPYGWNSSQDNNVPSQGGGFNSPTGAWDKWGNPVTSNDQPLTGYNNPRVRAHAMGGIMMQPHLGMVGEAGPEAVIPLNQRGISVLAGALTEAYQSLNTQGARSHIHYDSSSHHYDHSIDVSGPITVMSEDPNEMGRKLAAKARSRNLTATQTRKYG